MGDSPGTLQFVGAAMFGFLAIGAVALFSFLSVASWLGARSAERKARDRFAMLKAVLEHPGENGDKVLAAWREQELRKEHQDRRERIMGGAVTTAVGVALAVMLAALTEGKGNVWTVGLIPIGVGVVIALFGIFEKPQPIDE